MPEQQDSFPSESKGSSSGLQDFFKPLNLASTRKPHASTTKKKQITAKSPRSRSVKFADEKQEAQLMLESILLFEPDASFCDSSVVEAVMEDFHESVNSFDSWEYAHGGNCPSPSSPSKNGFIHQPINRNQSYSTLEQQVRDQQARELREKKHRGATKAVAQALVEEAEKTEAAAASKSTAEVPTDIFLAGLPDVSFLGEEEMEKLSKSEAAAVAAVAPNNNDNGSSLDNTISSPYDQERRKARQGNLSKALQKSPSLRMLEETAKARKARTEERLREEVEFREKKAKEFKEQQEANSNGNAVARRRRASFEPRRVARQQRQQQQQENDVKPKPAKTAPRRTKTDPIAYSNTKSETKAKSSTTNETIQPVEKRVIQTVIKRSTPDPKPRSALSFPKTNGVAPLSSNGCTLKTTSNKIKVDCSAPTPAVTTPSKFNGKPSAPTPAVAAVAAKPVLSSAHQNSQSAQQRRLSELSEMDSSAKSVAARWGKPSSATESSAQQNAQSAQQKRLSELKGISGSKKKSTQQHGSSTAAQNAQSAHQRRLNELNAVKEQSMVGGNVLSKRERFIVKLQAAARMFLVQTHAYRHRRRQAAAQLQALVRGCLVRKCIADVQAKIAALEQHVSSMARAKENQLASIIDSPELRSRQDQLDDAGMVARKHAMVKERRTIKDGIASFTDEKSQIEKSMESLRINSKSVAKLTREIEWQSSKLLDHNAMLEKTQQQLISKNQQVQAKITKVEEEMSTLENKTEVEQAVGKISHRTILKIREHTKTAAQKGSSDPFLMKVHRRSKILDRLSDGKKRALGKEVCPVIVG